MGGSGITTIAPGGALAISGPGGKDFTGRTLNIYGTAIWSGSGRIRSTTGGDYDIINNFSGAVFEAQSTASMERNNSIDPLLVFNNAGTFRKTGAGTTTTIAEAAFINTGMLELRSGKLRLPNGGGFASAGTLSFLISGPTAGVQYGQYETGRAALDGGFNVSLANGFRPTGCDAFDLMKFLFKTGNLTSTNGLDLGGGLSFIMNMSDTNLTLVTAAPQPCLGSLVYSTNGEFQFQLTGQIGSNYVIQASTNLTTWIRLATNAISGSGSFLFNDPSATNFSQRYYRALLQ